MRLTWILTVLLTVLSLVAGVADAHRPGSAYHLNQFYRHRPRPVKAAVQQSNLKAQEAIQQAHARLNNIKRGHGKKSI